MSERRRCVGFLYWFCVPCVSGYEWRDVSHMHLEICRLMSKRVQEGRINMNWYECKGRACGALLDLQNVS